MQQLSFRAMGSTMTVVIDCDGPAVRAALVAARKTFIRYERILSRFDPASELNALNRRAGLGPVRVSKTLWHAVQHALAMAWISDGLVTPTVGAALAAAGYDRDFAALAATGEPDADLAPVPVPDWRLLRCDPARRTIALPAGVRLDLGGSAKGWTAALVARQVGRRFPTLVDAGGDIAISGPRHDGSPWPIEVADPFRPEQGLDLLLVRRGAVATSGIDYRRWQRHGRWMHHLIDPRTGAPAETDLIAVTVIAPTLPMAEIAAKVVLLLGQEKGCHWLTTQPRLTALLVTAAGQVIRSPGFARYCWSARPAHSRRTLMIREA